MTLDDWPRPSGHPRPAVHRRGRARRAAVRLGVLAMSVLLLGVAAVLAVALLGRAQLPHRAPLWVACSLVTGSVLFVAAGWLRERVRANGRAEALGLVFDAVQRGLRQDGGSRRGDPEQS